MIICQNFVMKYHFLNLKMFYRLYLIVILVFLIMAAGVFFYQQTWGVKGQYYSNIQWEGEPAFTRTDSTPYLKEDTGYNLTSTEAYSVKWSGWIMITRTGIYRFVTNSDDGSYLWLNKALMIDNGGPHGLRRVSTEISLEEGIYPIEILYFQIGGESVMQTRWAPPGKIETQIPAEVLFQKRPRFFDLFVRKSVLRLCDLLKTNWVSIVMGICLIGILLFLSYRQILTSWKPLHMILLCSAGFFLLGALLIRYGSTYVSITGYNIPTWHVETNSNAEDAKLAIDRRNDTAWTTDQPMQPNMFFQVNLEQSLRIGKIVLSHGEIFDNYPRAYRVEVSIDGIHWEKIQIAESRLVTSESIELFVTPRTFQYMRILQTGHSHMHWTIQELYLYSPAWIPWPYQYPLFITFLVGFLGATTCLGLSLRHLSQSCGKLILCGLVIIIIAGFGLRIFMIRYHDLNVNERQYLFESLSYLHSDVEWARQMLNTDHRRTAILYLYLTRWLFKVCHISSLSIRLMSALLGTLTIPLTFYVWRNISTRQEKCFEALIVAAIIATNILHVCWSRDGHSQIQMTFFYICYIYIASKALRLESRPHLLFWGSGIILFIGFFFHGSMLVAPIGIVIFIVLDALMTRGHIPDWQSIVVKNYVFLMLSSLIFGGYVYYVLTMQGGFTDAERYAHVNIHKNVDTISYMFNFLQTRWNLLVYNLNDSDLLQDYDFLSPWFLPIWGIILIGFINVLYRRQKAEWCLLFQPILFGLMISSLWTTSKFERFLLPILLSISVFAARGIIVVSEIFRKPVVIAITRSIVSILIVLSLSFITVYRIFWEQPPYTSEGAWVYTVYSGKQTSFMRWVQYVKHSPCEAKSIVMCTDPWIAPYYPNIFAIPISFLEPMKLRELINKAQTLPVFIILTPSADKELIAVIEQEYNLVETSTFYWDLYELRDEEN
jgi:hypothetical protein